MRTRYHIHAGKRGRELLAQSREIEIGVLRVSVDRAPLALAQDAVAEGDRLIVEAVVEKYRDRYFTALTPQDVQRARDRANVLLEECEALNKSKITTNDTMNRILERHNRMAEELSDLKARVKAVSDALTQPRRS